MVLPGGGYVVFSLKALVLWNFGLEYGCIVAYLNRIVRLVRPPNYIKPV